MAAAADAASFNPAPAEGWAYIAGPDSGYVRSPATARGGGFGGDGGDGGRFGGDGGDGGGAEEASAVLSAEHGHFAMAAMSAEALPVELHSDRPPANGGPSTPLGGHAPIHRAVAVDGSVHVAVSGGSVDAWLSKASDMEISRRRSFGADGEPLPA